MGFRTVVVLNNDVADVWSKDPLLGSKIAHGMNFAHLPPGDKNARLADLHYGRVVECQHADVQTLAIIDNIGFEALSHGSWSSRQTDNDKKLALLKRAAEELGLNLVKKRSKTKRKKIDERAKFEQYILTERGPAYLKRNDPKEDAEHDYEDHFVQEAWEAWQARSSRTKRSTTNA